MIYYCSICRCIPRTHSFVFCLAQWRAERAPILIFFGYLKLFSVCCRYHRTLETMYNITLWCWFVHTYIYVHQTRAKSLANTYQHTQPLFEGIHTPIKQTVRTSTSCGLHSFCAWLGGLLIMLTFTWYVIIHCRVFYGGTRLYFLFLRFHAFFFFSFSLFRRILRPSRVLPVVPVVSVVSSTQWAYGPALPISILCSTR